MEVSPPAANVPAARPLTTTERNWLTALAIVIGGTLLAALVMAAEKQAGLTNRHDRVVYNPVESFMRYLTMPHFILAIVFMTTSKGMRGAKPWTWLVGLTALGVGLCVAFHAAGGRGGMIANALFLGYFLVHEFRDQAFFYRIHGDSVRGAVDAKRARRHVALVPVLGLLAIVAGFLFGAAFRIGGTRRYTEAVYGALSPEVRGTIGVLAVILVAGACHLTKRSWDRTYPGGARGFLRMNRPIFVVFGGILAVLVLDIVLNGRAYAIVTLHVAAWYVFVTRGFAAKPAPDPAPKRWSWAWFRGTRSGFLWMHNTLFVLILAAGVYFAYGLGNDPGSKALWVLTSKDAFPYWTIMHVTISFVPR